MNTDIQTDQTNKTLEDLYLLADNILALKHNETLKSFLFGGESDYRYLCFSTSYCGEPKIYANLKLPKALSKTFPTYINDVEFKGCNYCVECRELTNVKDLDGYQVYEASNGTLFIYRYVEPSLMSHIDAAMFYPPRIEFEDSEQFHTIFSKASDTLVESMVDSKDTYSKLKLMNIITELQMSAFMQGLGYKALPTTNAVS